MNNISLRDYFAAKVMQSALYELHIHSLSIEAMEDIAKNCYEMADAMIRVGHGATLESSELTPANGNYKTAIERALTECKTINEAAKQLGMSRATFWRKRKLYQL